MDSDQLFNDADDPVIESYRSLVQRPGHKYIQECLECQTIFEADHWQDEYCDQHKRPPFGEPKTEG